MQESAKKPQRNQINKGKAHYIVIFEFLFDFLVKIALDYVTSDKAVCKEKCSYCE